MIKKNYKGRCEKKSLAKCEGVCRLYNKIQIAYANELMDNEDIVGFQCNVLLDGTDYTTDFLCEKNDGTYRVRECVQRHQMTWPSVVKLLDISREYWTKRGIEDWGIVVNKEEKIRKG